MFVPLGHPPGHTAQWLAPLLSLSVTCADWFFRTSW